MDHTPRALGFLPAGKMLGPSDLINVKLFCLVKSSSLLTHSSTSHPGTLKSTEGILNNLISIPKEISKKSWEWSLDTCFFYSLQRVQDAAKTEKQQTVSAEHTLLIPTSKPLPPSSQSVQEFTAFLHNTNNGPSCINHQLRKCPTYRLTHKQILWRQFLKLSPFSQITLACVKLT